VYVGKHHFLARSQPLPFIVTTVEGNQLRISYSVDGSVQVDRSTVIQEDIYASNGVLHVVSSLLTKPETFQINAEKYLLALNATSFVSLLRTANLSHYVDDEHDSQSWTLLAPRDDVIGGSNMNDVVQDLGRVLQYHIIPGKLLPAQLTDGMLLGTELREEGLNGHRQRLHVSVATKDGTVQGDSNGAVGFGDAQVISEPGMSRLFMSLMMGH
jgi:solute carrier family 25 (mitochondrial carnitine/acylcarnitine transporter), member 20/29